MTLFACSVLLFAAGATCQQAADDVKIVEGYGLSSTQPDALTQAKRDAIEKGIGVMLLSRQRISCSKRT